MSGAIKSIDRNGVREDTFLFGPWTIQADMSHILASRCIAPVVCNKTEDKSGPNVCIFCRFTSGIELPSLPEMTFAQNRLQVTHHSGIGLEFNVFDALKSVKKGGPAGDIQVGLASEWQVSRNLGDVRSKVFNNFDWTFRTDYIGSLIGNLKVEPTDEEIDMQKLMTKEEILYYEQIDLFEDELNDHGVCNLNVKIRVMKKILFILLRYFLRVDNILIRIQDTRIYYEVGNNYMIRECTEREAVVETPSQFTIEQITDPAKMCSLLPVLKRTNEKIILPST